MLLDLGEAQERPGWIAIARNRCDWLEDVLLRSNYRRSSPSGQRKVRRRNNKIIGFASSYDSRLSNLLLCINLISIFMFSSFHFMISAWIQTVKLPLRTITLRRIKTTRAERAGSQQRCADNEINLIENLGSGRNIFRREHEIKLNLC